MYQIGDITNIQESDPTTTVIENAYVMALDMAEESDEVFIGIWELDDNGDAELIAIVYQGDIFTK